MTGTSHHAHTDALWGPWEHGYQDLTRSSHSRHVAVVREWVRQGAQARKRSAHARPTLCGLTEHFREAARRCVPRGTTSTMRGAPTSPGRTSGWWTRYPFRCGCRANAQVPPQCWCGARAGRGRGRQRPPPPRWRCSPPSMATSRRWLSPPQSIRRYRLWLPPYGRSVHPTSPGRQGAGCEGKGTDPQRNPGPLSVARPPRHRLGAPFVGTHAEVAGRSQGLDPRRCACIPSGGGHRRASGENHQ